MNIKSQLIIDMHMTEKISEFDVSEVPENFNGDYSLSCFNLAKEKRRSLATIAQQFVADYVPKLNRGKVSDFVSNRMLRCRLRY